MSTNKFFFNVLTLLSMSNIVLKFPVYKMETGNFTVYVTYKPEKFPFYEMETVNFTVYVRNPEKISGLRNENWKFYGLRYVNRKNFRFTKWKLEILRFTLR